MFSSSDATEKSPSLTKSSVVLWGASVLVDPAELSYYRRSPMLADVSASNSEAQQCKDIAKPCVVVAAGICSNAISRRSLLGSESLQLEAEISGDTTSKVELVPEEDVCESVENRDQCPVLPYLLIYDFKLDSQLSSLANKPSNSDLIKSLNESSSSSSVPNSAADSGTTKVVTGGSHKVSNLAEIGMKAGKVKMVHPESYQKHLPAILKGKSSSEDKSGINKNKSDSLRVSSSSREELPSCVQLLPLPRHTREPRVSVMFPTACGTRLIVCLEDSASDEKDEAGCLASYHIARSKVNDASLVKLEKQFRSVKSLRCNEIIVEAMALPASVSIYIFFSVKVYAVVKRILEFLHISITIS